MEIRHVDYKNKLIERKTFVNSVGSEQAELKNESFFSILPASRIRLRDIE